MKKLFISLMVPMLYVSILSAQLRLNVGAGLNLSDLKYNNDMVEGNISPALNYFVSARPELGVFEKLSVAVDVQFSRKGYLIDSSTVVTPSAYRIQYLDVLPQAQYRFINAAAIYAGLGVGFRLSEKAKFNDTWQNTLVKFSNKTDVSYILGLRFFPFDKLSAHIQISGMLSDFNDIEFTNNFGEMIDVKSKLQNFQLGIAYQIL